MAANEIHKSDIGVRFRVTIKDGNDIVNISSATTRQIWLRKPSGEVLTTSGAFLTDGTDGIMYYDTVDGDLDEVGTWKIQGYVVIGGKEFHSDYQSFKVYRNIN